MTHEPSTATPRISVVVTCFNYARYVGEAIESVLTQDYPNRELVVVNDGSTDASSDVIGCYRAFARVIEQRNLGQLAACDQGFSATRGEIVIFLDADDRLEPGALTEVARAWSRDAAKVQYDLKIIDAEGRDSGRRFCHFPPSYDAARVRAAFSRTGTYRWPVTAGNAYSRWFVERLFPFSATLPPGAFLDGFLNTVAPVYGNVTTVARALACYRLHGANGWSSTGAEHARLSDRIARRQQEVAFLREHATHHAVSVPPGNVLDHELAFINYRLMAMKLGVDYPSRSADSPWGLVARAFRLLRVEGYPPRVAAIHWLWFGLLLISPRWVAERLISLRFERAAVRKRLEQRFRQVGRRLQRAA